jgi:hypothetical protein
MGEAFGKRVNKVGYLLTQGFELSIYLLNLEFSDNALVATSASCRSSHSLHLI